MIALLYIYCFCIIGAALCILQIESFYKNNPDIAEGPEERYYVNLWLSQSVYSKAITMFVPILNLFFTLIGLFVIYIRIKSFIVICYQGLGCLVTLWFVRNRKHFIIKEFIIRHCFPKYIEPFYLYFENDMLSRLVEAGLKAYIQQKKKLIDAEKLDSDKFEANGITFHRLKEDEDTEINL